MGEDGHIASLFPGSRLLGEKQKLVMLDPVKRKGSLRMTLSLSMLTHALETVLLASGSEKINLLASKSARTNLPINQLIENNTNITVICTED
jgi:6-phosphogluconolactonase